MRLIRALLGRLILWLGDKMTKALSIWIMFAIIAAGSALIWHKANAMTVRPQNVVRLTAIKQHIGLHERKNRSTIRRIVGVDPVRTPWCGAAAAYSVRKANQKPPQGYLKASSWRHWGKAVSFRNARPGDVIVYRFKRGYHVAIFEKHLGKGRHRSCGWNMSNRFKCSNYRNSSVKAVRR